MHGYSFEGDPRVKDSIRKLKEKDLEIGSKIQKSRGSSANLRSLSPALRKVNSSDFQKTTDSQVISEKNTRWGSYKQSNLMSDGSVIYDNDQPLIQTQNHSNYLREKNLTDFYTESTVSQKMDAKM